MFGEKVKRYNQQHKKNNYQAIPVIPAFEQRRFLFIQVAHRLWLTVRE
jgi:hypothetical protein